MYRKSILKKEEEEYKKLREKIFMIFWKEGKRFP